MVKNILQVFAWCMVNACLLAGTAQAQRAASAVPTVVNGFVVSVSVTDGGEGYAQSPAITFTGGGGSGAAALATVSNGVVSRIIVTSAGNGYTNPPSVAVEAPAALTNDLSSGLVLHYLLDGNAVDVSDNGHLGKIVGASPAPDRDGQTNSCLYFNGDSDYIETDADDLPQTERSVSLWFKAERVSKWTLLLGYGGDYAEAGPSTYFMSLHGNQATVETHYNGYDSRAVVVGYDFGQQPLNAWHHWLVTVSDSQIKYFWDGALILKTNVAFRPTYTAGKKLFVGITSGPDGMGPFQDINTSYFKGWIDDVRIYDRALSDSEASELYATELTRLPYVTVAVASVRVNMHVQMGKVYQLQSADSSLEWTDLGLPFVATTSILSQTFEAANGARFYRLVEVK